MLTASVKEQMFQAEAVLSDSPRSSTKEGLARQDWHTGRNGAFYYLDEAVLSDIPRNSTQEDLAGKDGILQTSKLHQMFSCWIPFTFQKSASNSIDLRPTETLDL